MIRKIEFDLKKVDESSSKSKIGTRSLNCEDIMGETIPKAMRMKYGDKKMLMTGVLGVGKNKPTETLAVSLKPTELIVAAKVDVYDLYPVSVNFLIFDYANTSAIPSAWT
jgi:hypothetical protein